MELERIKKIVEQISKVEEEISNLKNSIGELEEEAKEVKEWPQIGDKYYSIGTFGGVADIEYRGDNEDFDAFRIGNAFKTKEEAEFEVEKKKVIIELSRFCEPYNTSTYNNYIYYSHDEDELKVYVRRGGGMGAYCFENEDVALKAIKNIGEKRIKKYLFGVEE